MSAEPGGHIACLLENGVFDALLLAVFFSSRVSIAMRTCDIGIGMLSVCPSVCPSRSDIVSKRLNVIIATFSSVPGSPVVLVLPVPNTFAKCPMG